MRPGRRRRRICIRGRRGNRFRAKPQRRSETQRRLHRCERRPRSRWSSSSVGRRSEEHTSELQSRQYLHSFPTRRSSDLRRGEGGPPERSHGRGEGCDRGDVGEESASEEGAGTDSERSHKGGPRRKDDCTAASEDPDPDGRRVPWDVDRKSTRLNSSHANIYTLSLHDALPISVEAKAVLPNVHTVAVKDATGATSAKNLHPRKAREQIQSEATKAVRDAKTIAPLRAKTPIQMVVEFRGT